MSSDRRYALLGHTHTGLGTAAEWGSITGTLSTQTDLQAALDAKAASSHTHGTADITDLASYTGLDVRYYTETEVDTLLNAKAPTASPTFTGTVDVSAATMTGLSSEDLSDRTTIAMTDEGEEITGTWSFLSTGFSVGVEPVTATLIGQWNTAYGWGDHSTQNYAVTTGDTFTGNITLARTAANNALLFNSASTTYDADVHYQIAGVLTALVRWDSSINTMLWQDRNPSTVTQMSLNLDTGALAVTGDVTGANLNISNWNTAYGWGDHASGGYAVKASNETITGNWTFNTEGISDVTIYRQDATSAAGIGFRNTDGYKGYIGFADSGSFVIYNSAGTGQAYFTSTGGLYVSTADAGGDYVNKTRIGNWNTAYGWGDHASGGYALLSGANFTGDVQLNSNVTLRASDGKIYPNTTGVLDFGGGGNRWLKGYFVSVDVNGTNITSALAADWSTAFGWGNHASAGYAVEATAVDFDSVLLTPDTTSDVWGLRLESSNNTLNDSGFWSTSDRWRLLLRDAAGTIGVSLDPGSTNTSSFAGHVAVTGNVTGANLNVANWDTAYGWGNHASAGYYAATGGTISGAVQINGGITMGDGTGRLLFDEAGSGDVRCYFAPRNAGDTNWDWGKEFGYNHTNGRWYCESDLQVGANIITSAKVANWDTAYGWGDHSVENYAVTTGDTFTGALNIQGGGGSVGQNLDSTLSWTSGTLNAPALRWREADGTSIAAIRGYVNSSGGNVLALGLGWMTNVMTLDSSGADLTGNLVVSGTVDGVDIAALDAAVAKTADNETISGTWNFTGTKTTMNQLFINESASADADVAGDGQFWVKNDAPNTPWFTDDAGNDYPLGTAAYRLYANQTDTVDGLYVNAAWYSDNATAYTLTLEASSSTNFPVGGQFTIWNEGSGTLTINEGTGDTLYLMDGSSVTDTAGGCTMAQGGYATVIRKSAAVWLIMGAGLTA